MDFELRPDFEKSFARCEAFWNRAVIDRPLVQLSITKVRDTSLKRHYPDHRARWLDIDARVDDACRQLERSVSSGLGD